MKPDSKNRISILGLIQGDVNDPLSRAGVNYRLYRELGKISAIVNVLDVEPAGMRRYLLALFCFRPNKRKWAKSFYENPRIFEERTFLAGKQIAGLDDQFDAILQDGAMWLPGRDKTEKPLVSYHDSNVILGSRGGAYAQGSHYKGKKLRRAIELEKEVYDRASYVLTFSEWVRRSMIEDFHLQEAKVKVMRPGVNFEIPENFPKNYEEPMILFVGRDFVRKGGPVLLEAFRKVRREIKKASLTILGCSPNIREDGVIIKGLIPREREAEIKRLYRKASVFVMPSYFEPFGLVFLEAMAYKLPCIGTNVCAMPEMIGEGECGFIVEPGNSDQLANRLITLLANEKLMAEMGDRAHKRVRTQYTWEKAAMEIAGYCHELL